MRTFNARLYDKGSKSVIEARLDLTAEEVCDFARDVSKQVFDRHASLLVEQLWNGENEQQYLDREYPGATASGFVFYAKQLAEEGIDSRCQDFLDVFGDRK